MKKTEKHPFQPDILGISWIPGDLVLIGSECRRSDYVLGNCIVAGTKDILPVAYFAPQSNPMEIAKKVMEMAVGVDTTCKGDLSLNNMPEYPLFIDCTPTLSVACLVERIFHFAKEHAVRMVVIDCLQDIDGSVFSVHSKEQEMKYILRILKSLAEAFDLLMVVTSRISDNVRFSNEKPQLKDLLYIPMAEELCDQIILIHLKGFMTGGTEYYQLTLPKGFPVITGEFREVIINAMVDPEKGFFRKADNSFRKDYSISNEPPMYEWFQCDTDGAWHFDFLDSTGMTWSLVLEPDSDSDTESYSAIVSNQDKEEFTLIEKKRFTHIDDLMTLALNIAREHFPEVEIPARNQNIITEKDVEEYC